MLQLLDILPEEVLEAILSKLLDYPEDLKNCSIAHPRLDEELNKWKCLYLFPQVLPLILKYLPLKDAIKIPDVCTRWRDAVNDLDNQTPGKLPYNDKQYLCQLDKLEKDLCDDKLYNDIWFLSFNNIGRDTRSFQRAIEQSSSKIHSRIGRSASFRCDQEKWQMQLTYLNKLLSFLESFGEHFWYVKITVIGLDSARIEQLRNCSFIRLLLSHLPNARSIDISMTICDQGECITRVEHIPIPELPLLESLSVSLGRRTTRLRERHLIAKYGGQLKKLKLTARPGNLPQLMPCLVELYLHDIQVEDILEDLQLLEAPLEKLTLDFHDDNLCKMDMTIVLSQLVHLPLRQLVLSWRTLKRHLIEVATYKNIDPKFKEIQFANLHTFTICNYPEEWYPLLVSFPALTYFNVRDVIPLNNRDTGCNKRFWKKEEILIKRILYGHQEKFTIYPRILCKTNFPQLQQVCVEMSNEGELGKLVHCRKWKRKSSLKPHDQFSSLRIED